MESLDAHLLKIEGFGHFGEPVQEFKKERPILALDFDVRDKDPHVMIP